MVSIKEPLNIEYMTVTLHVFYSAPPTKKNEDYIPCLNNIEAKMSEIWKLKGIFDLIQLSRTYQSYCQNMMVASLYFWKSITNTFQLPCGMVTPTLFDITTITGLRPTNNNFDLIEREREENTISFNTNRASFDKYIKDYHVTDNPEVSDEEHIVFLAM